MAQGELQRRGRAGGEGDDVELVDRAEAWGTAFALPAARAGAVQPSKMDAPVGGTLVVRDAIMGLVTRSANDAAVVIASVGRGTTVKTVGMVFDKTPLNIFSLKEKPLSKPKDLEGKTLAAARATTNFIMANWFAAQLGLDMKKVSVVNTAPTGLIGYALRREIFGNRAIYHEGWVAATTPAPLYCKLLTPAMWLASLATVPMVPALTVSWLVTRLPSMVAEPMLPLTVSLLSATPAAPAPPERMTAKAPVVRLLAVKSAVLAWALATAADPDEAVKGWRAKLTFIARQRWALVGVIAQGAFRSNMMYVGLPVLLRAVF